MPYVNNHGVKIHYQVAGQGSPLVLLHGFGDSLESWRQYGYVAALQDGYQLILIDARGHGLSDKPHDEEAYGFVLMVADVVATLDDMSISKAHYFGYSMGANAGYYLPFYAPGRFDALILGGWAFARAGQEATDHRAMFAVHKAIRQAIAEDPAHPMAAFVARIERRLGPLPPALKAHYLGQDALALAAIAGAHGHPAGPGIAEILSPINMPCFIYTGENDPILEAAREVARRIPEATFLSFPGLDHRGCFEQSAAVLPHIKNYLGGVINK
jgi:pimeloyl-ACP methyl ester carboxylesterase